MYVEPNDQPDDLFLRVVYAKPSPSLLENASDATSFSTLPGSRFGHSVRRRGQFVCPNSDTICPNSDKKYLTIVTFRFLLLFFAY